MPAIQLQLESKGAMTKHLKRIADALGNGASLQVGFLEDATYPKGLAVAQVAFWNEYGTAGAPARPFMRFTVATKGPRWGHALGVICRRENYNAERSLALMGEGIRDQIVKSIVDWKEPPNSPSTVARKGFNKPLIDTGFMQRSVDYQVFTGLGDD